MPESFRPKQAVTVETEGKVYQATIIETPFREGIELECNVDDYCLRVSDLGLGLDEAIRQLKQAIKETLS